MLREYQLTNFKAFAGPETIPIRPITLIFGPNSSGKSSILQSLLLLKQTAEEAENPETVLLPKGSLTDLGSYHEFVHRHEVSRQFSFRALFTHDAEAVGSPWLKRLLENGAFSQVGLNIVFSYDEKKGTVGCRSVDVFVGDEMLPLLSYSPLSPLSRKQVPGSVAINLENSFWRTWWTVTKQYIEEELEDVDFAAYKGKVEYSPFVRLRQDLRSYSFDRALKDLKWDNIFRTWPAEFLEEWEALAEKALAEKEQAGQNRPSSSADSPKKQSTEVDSPFDVHLIYPSSFGADPFEGGLNISPVIFHVSSVFQQLVRGLVYLGPLRNPPERYYTFSGDVTEHVGRFGERLPDILFKNRKLVDQVNADLARLGFGYKLEVVPLKEEGSNPSNIFTIRIVNKEDGLGASIRDVGFGISQVLPIIAQSRLSFNKTLLIEQPEIHLHPAHQAELGDVFIQSALGEQKNTFILETHSEHLILRIMRRMRDTANGTLPTDLPRVRPEDVAILYVQPKDPSAVVRVLELDNEGQLLDPWPGGFFEEGFRERFD